MKASAVAPSPVRLTTKQAPEEVDPALFRRTVSAVADLTGAPTKKARQRVRAWVAGGQPLDDLEAYLRATFRMDPTGVTAVRNAS